MTLFDAGDINIIAVLLAVSVGVLIGFIIRGVK